MKYLYLLAFLLLIFPQNAENLTDDYDGSDSPFFQAILTGNPTGIDASQMAWDFLSQYSKSMELDEG